ncbi:MAG: VOC family protein [Dehalococcoidia bacterium]
MDVTSFSITINSTDPERLLGFYRETVGLTENPEADGGGFRLVEGATLYVDGHREISGPTKEPARVLVNFFVDDLKAEQARLEAAGVEFIRKEGREFWGGVISTFLDPDGNYCQLMEFNPE